MGHIVARQWPLFITGRLSRSCKHTRSHRALPITSRRLLSLSIPSDLQPTFASSSPPSWQLQINDIKKIPTILRELQAYPDRAKQFTNVVICESEVEDDGKGLQNPVPSDQGALPQNSVGSIAQDKYKSDSKISDNNIEELSAAVVEILDNVRGDNGVDAFQWSGPDEWSGFEREGKRPAVFWETLWKSAERLRALNLQFFDRELNELHEAQDKIPVCPDFPKLKTAILNAERAHGDNASFLDRWLQNCSALQLLDVRLPNCSFEGCQISGLTWDYYFPALEIFALRGYNCNSVGLAEFLRRSSQLRILTLDLEHEPFTEHEPFALLPNSLPNLEALSVNFNGVSELVSSVTPGFAATPLRHLRIAGCPYDSYPEFEALSGLIRCLELDFASDWEEQFRKITCSEHNDALANADSTTSPSLPQIIKALFPQLPKLQELALDLGMAYTTIYEGSGDKCTSRHPDAMNEKDLIIALQLLSPSTSIRALRMYDSRGIPLTAEFLDNIPGVPQNLEYIKWGNEARSVLYRLERDAERVRAVECDTLKRSEGKGFWVDNRVLDFDPA